MFSRSERGGISEYRRIRPSGAQLFLLLCSLNPGRQKHLKVWSKALHTCWHAVGPPVGHREYSGSKGTSSEIPEIVFPSKPRPLLGAGTNIFASAGLRHNYGPFCGSQLAGSSVVGGDAGAVERPPLVDACPSVETGVGVALVPICEVRPDAKHQPQFTACLGEEESHRGNLPRRCPVEKQRRFYSPGGGGHRQRHKPGKVENSHRLLGVLKVLAGLLVGAQLLVTFPLQVPLEQLLDQVHVRPLGPQKQTAGVRCAEHCKQFMTRATRL